MLSLPNAKPGKIAANKVTIRHDINKGRFHASIIEGIKVSRDEYQNDNLLNSILQAKRVLVPIVVHKNKDADTVDVLQGNLRTTQVLRIQNMSDIELGERLKTIRDHDATATDPEIVADREKSIDELVKEIRDNLNTIPCMVYENLTPSQITQVVNDQKGTLFSQSGVIRLIWDRMNEGAGFNTLAYEFATQLAQCTPKGRESLAKVEVEKDPEKKQKKLKSWLSSNLQIDVMYSNVMGPRVRRLFLMGKMRKDGLTLDLPQRDADEFPMDRDALQALHKAYLQDVKAGQWHPINEGPVFKQKWNDLCKEYWKTVDKKGQPDADGDGTSEPDAPDNSQVTAVMNTILSSSARAMKHWLSTGQGLQTLQHEDTKAFGRENVETVLRKAIDNVKDERMKALLQAIVNVDSLAVETAAQPFTI